MLKKIRKIILCLFVLQTYTGVFKIHPSQAFGHGSVFQDITFRVVLIIAIYFVIFFISSKPKERYNMFYRMLTLKPMLLMLVIVWISYSINPSSLGYKKALYFTLFVIPMSLLFVAMLKEKEEIVWPINFLFSFGLFMSCIAFIFQTRAPFYFLSSGFNAPPTLTGRFWGYLKFAPLASMTAIIGIVNFVEKKIKWPLKIFFLASSIIALSAAAYSGERASLVIFVFLMASYLSFLYIKSYGSLLKKRVALMFMVVFVIMIFVLPFIESERGELFREGWHRAVDFRHRRLLDVRINIRGEFFQPFFKNIEKSPLIGVGVGNYFAFPKYSEDWPPYPHNMFLEIGGELGIIGLLVYFWILGRFVKGMVMLYDKTTQKHIAFAAIMGGLFFFIRTFKTGDIVGNRMFWLFVSYFLYISRLKKEE